MKKILDLKTRFYLADEDTAEEVPHGSDEASSKTRNVSRQKLMDLKRYLISWSLLAESDPVSRASWSPVLSLLFFTE